MEYCQRLMLNRQHCEGGLAQVQALVVRRNDFIASETKHIYIFKTYVQHLTESGTVSAADHRDVVRHIYFV